MNNLSKLFQKYETIVVLDVETTGLDAKSCHVIEVSITTLPQRYKYANSNIHTENI